MKYRHVVVSVSSRGTPYALVAALAFELDSDSRGSLTLAMLLTALRPARTTCSAASPIESAVVKFRPLSFSICLPSSTFVPSMRMTIGTRTPRSVTAAMTPCASTSQRRMPPKMLISTALTLVSDIRMRNAFLICSALAPPPTSRKFAGSPPASLMMSIVAIARPAPLTMQPIVPSSLM